MMAVSAAVRFTPLCHSVTSPPQGGRVGTHALRQSNSQMFDVMGNASGVPLSPHVGEMPGRAEGGSRTHHPRRTTP